MIQIACNIFKKSTSLLNLGFVIKRLRNVGYDFHRQIAFLINTNLIRATQVVLIFKRRGLDCYEPAYEIHSASPDSRESNGRESAQLAAVTTATVEIERNERVEKGMRAKKKPKRDRARSETRA